MNFGDPQTITVEDLRVGDFVVTILPHHQFRATKVNSAVRTITDSGYHGMRETRGRGRGGMDLRSRKLTFASVEGGYHLPSDNEVVVRRIQP